MTNRQLEKLCAVWQKRLRLQDWAIRVSYARQNAFIEDGRLGETVMSSNNKMATIQVLDHKDRDRYVAISDEVILVHELVHLHVEPPFEFVKELPETNRMLLEQAIHCIATGFVEAYECE